MKTLTITVKDSTYDRLHKLALEERRTANNQAAVFLDMLCESRPCDRTLAQYIFNLGFYEESK